MKYTVYINTAAAIRAGAQKAGHVTADIDLSQFTAAEREILASRDYGRASSVPSDSAYFNNYTRGVLDTENLIAEVRAVIENEADVKADHLKAVERQINDARETIAEGKIPFVNYSEAVAVVTEWPEYKALVAKRDAQIAANEQARKEDEARKAEAKAKAEAEAKTAMLAWIAERGSDRLRRCVAEGIDCRVAYRNERLTLERPGWKWWCDVRGDENVPIDPPSEAFALIDYARKTAPDAKLIHVMADAETDDVTGEEIVPEIDGYAALADFLGYSIVFGNLWA